VNQDMPRITLSNPSTLPPPMRFSHLAKVNHGQMLYISGQVARDESGEIICKGDFRAQLEQVFRNLQTAGDTRSPDFLATLRENTRNASSWHLG
jgi:enamine deaminase RidA (YjgF/YER057c/UK114 family)